MVGAVSEAVVFHREPPQHPRCGEIGSLGEEKMSIIIECNIGKMKLFMYLSKNHMKTTEIRCISENSTFL